MPVWNFPWAFTSKCVLCSLQEMEMRNSELERRIQNSEQNLINSLEERDRIDTEIQKAIEILDIKIFDLNDLRQSLVKLTDRKQ